jgi:hypothetical protein
MYGVEWQYDWWMNDKDVEGIGRGLIETKFQHFRGGTKENHWKLPSGELPTCPTFEPDILNRSLESYCCTSLLGMTYTVIFNHAGVFYVLLLRKVCLFLKCTACPPSTHIIKIRVGIGGESVITEICQLTEIEDGNVISWTAINVRFEVQRDDRWVNTEGGEGGRGTLSSSEG